MNKTNDDITDTGERMIPKFHKNELLYAEHMIRYTAAVPLVKNKVVLDIASGTGYGSKLLARNAIKVYGIDSDKKAISYACNNFNAKNIEYKVGDAINIPLSDSSVDIVVTFETIEHIKDYNKFIKEVKRVLKPSGLTIISTPNDLEFAEGNHFHLHEFKYDELIKVLKKDFDNIVSYYQATWKSVAIGPEKIFKKIGNLDSSIMNYAPIKPEQYLYFYLLCSNRKITESIDSLVVLGKHYSDREEIKTQMEYANNTKALEKQSGELIMNTKALQKQNNELTEKLNEVQGTVNNILNSKSWKIIRAFRAITKIPESNDKK
jgi:ubiquinone/menaquinone biosynthesis C-methylase UbiE